MAAGGTTLPPPPRPAQPTWQRDVQIWATEQERLRHVQALWQYGELCAFALTWRIEDLQAAGGALPRCYMRGTNETEDTIAAAYGQGNQAACPVCFNTTFIADTTALPAAREPLGLRALLLRPTLWADLDTDQRMQPRGVAHTGEVDIVETTPDFRVKTGDYLLRAGGERYYLRVPSRVTLSDGFASQWQSSTALTYNQMRPAQEEPTSPAYLIPADQFFALFEIYTRIPVDYSAYEVINGPLIPETPPPAAYGAYQPPVTIEG
jgi:hypothetical protein